MAKACSNILKFKHSETDDVEKSLELLDKVLSEFEDPDSLPPAEPDSPLQGLQSEDDGYMSMNGRRLLSPDTTSITKDHRKEFLNKQFQNDKMAYREDGIEITPSQTTLPKTRPFTVIPSRYASLPSSSPPRLLVLPTEVDSGLDGCRTVLGIGISAVHDAVLRGVARIPEPIANEHPVTIYPGRSSPTKRVPPRTLSSSIERHREVCRINSSDSPSREIFNNSAYHHLSSGIEHPSIFNTSNILPSSAFNQSFTINNNIEMTCFSRHENRKSDCDDFSDDSLEGLSLPPPPPPPVVPLPSLSAPVTPSKRGNIAWEIMLEYDNIDGSAKERSPRYGKANFPHRSHSHSVSDSQTSLVSTSGNSAASPICLISTEWSEPPDMPVSSTEDEAASLHSDSEFLDDIVPYRGDINSHDTYVISKGRKRRQLSEFESLFNNKQINNENAGTTNSTLNSSIGLPYLRHSIDLGSPQPVQNSLNCPRSRLSLDLSSPTSEFPTKHLATNTSVLSPRYSEFKMYSSSHDGLQALENNNCNSSSESGNETNGSSNSTNNNLTLPLMRVETLTTNLPVQNDIITTPRRELAPPIEEDEEQDSEVQRAAPLRQIENNISALLRGDITVARVGDIPQSRRPLGFRPGVHKSESAKEMLLFQNVFGPLPPSPPSSSAEESDGFPPLPPSPNEKHSDEFAVIVNGIHSMSLTSRKDTIDERPPAVPPHRSLGPSLNTLKTRSMESEFSKSSRNNGPCSSLHDVQGFNTRRRLMCGAFPKRSAQSPREEKRLQTSCSLPETPIFARGCDVPRTPHRRAAELPVHSGSRTAPRQNSSLNTSIVGIGNTIGCRQRSISQALAGGEMLRQAGGPARGWYPRQRHPRPASTENLNRLNSHGSIRAWDSSTASRKPLTLPPNLTPKFFNKSPREALRRVTSLLIRKGNSSKDSKRDKEVVASTVFSSPGASGETKHSNTQKKKGFFKSFWKKSRHYSLEQ